MESPDTSNMKMAGTEMGNVVIGTDHCGAYKNALGNYEERKVSTICWISIVIVVIVALQVVQGALKTIQQADALKTLMTLFYGDVINYDYLIDFLKVWGYLAIISATLSAAITYFHCTRCNGGVAFFKLIGISMLSYAIVKFLWNRAVDETVDESSMPEEKKGDFKTILRTYI